MAEVTVHTAIEWEVELRLVVEVGSMALTHTDGGHAMDSGGAWLLLGRALRGVMVAPLLAGDKVCGRKKAPRRDRQAPT